MTLAFLVFALIYIISSNAQDPPTSCTITVSAPIATALVTVQWERDTSDINNGWGYYVYYIDSSGSGQTRYLGTSYTDDGSYFLDTSTTSWVNIDIDVSIDSQYSQSSFMYSYDPSNGGYSGDTYCTTNYANSPAPTSATPSPITPELTCNSAASTGTIVKSSTYPFDTSRDDYSFALPSTGVEEITISFSGTGWQPFVTLNYQGNELKNGWSGFTDPIFFNKNDNNWVPGDTYYIDIGEEGDSGDGGDYSISVACFDTTATPSPTKAPVDTYTSVTCNGNGVDAYLDIGETDNYSFTMPDDNTLISVIFSTCTTNYDKIDTVLYLSTSNGDSIKSNDDYDASTSTCTVGSSGPSEIIFSSTDSWWAIGSDYTLSVTGYYSGSTSGNYVLKATCNYGSNATPSPVDATTTNPTPYPVESPQPTPYTTTPSPSTTTPSPIGSVNTSEGSKYFDQLFIFSILYAVICNI